jgi:hypothetical protein
MPAVETTLRDFGKELRRQSRANLTRKKKNVSKGLYDSLDYYVKESPNSFEFAFTMAEYGDYVDKGVSGTDRKFNTPFSYKDKPPPFQNIFDWVKARRLYKRDKKTGRFTKGGQKALAFAIRQKIFTQGMESTHFYSKPFERLFKRLPQDIVEAYALDLRDFISFSRQNKRLSDG